ncbi:MAG: DUF3307 domain-containing protein, partial [Paludibacteraceae bacterium]|nr:DUF3307 domain-containing protein [Paludibacteraceae bacterium]
MNNDLLSSLLLTHIIGDFYLQTDYFCKQKETKKIKCWFLYVHSIIMGLIAWLLIPSIDFGIYAILIILTHLIIDSIKLYFSNSLGVFLADQLLHLGILLLISIVYETQIELPIHLIDQCENFSIPILLIATLICIKPTNIFIKLLLKKYDVGESKSCSNIKNAGGLIGNLERLLTMIFVIIGQFEAIGFVIAAKSILRFKDTDTAKTEY